LPEVAPLFAGYIAWRAILAEDALHDDLRDAMTFCLPPGEQFLGYLVTGPDNDLRPGQHHLVSARGCGDGAAVVAHRCERHLACDLDSAAAHPP
jgi:hypothetical protein